MKKKDFRLLALPSVKNIAQATKNFTFPIKLTKGKFKDLKFVFCNNKVKITHSGVDLKKFSFVWLSSSWSSRDLAYAIKLYLKSTKTPFTHVEKSTSKVTDQMLFSLNDIQTPNTLLIGRKEIEKSLDLIKKVCGYPLIVKDTKGSRGQHSLLINDEKELLKKMKGLPMHKRYLLQKYIPSEYDWGILVANGKVVAGEKKFPCEGEFRSNIFAGGSEIFIDTLDIPNNIKQMALKTSKMMGLSWSRSDIIVDKNTNIPYLMEINRRPGITSKSVEIKGAFEYLASQINYQ